MTLESYEPQEFDELALRLLDVAGTLRRLAVRCRHEELASMAINDRKALEWLGNIEAWASKAEADLELAILKRRGAQRAEVLARRKG